ncbi:hypothetical protein EB796_012603 [Bugula neritina]|uniref:Uncharacterized protein n=1 Tax=Bugula neritina TaxID=10212 RepID=A0A7J7JRY5_BUGNE|nr:hypothetical protein EB796_012603 [Bugula neritina]
MSRNVFVDVRPYSYVGSSGEDDESGLGDSESVLSCDLPVLSINLGNDISTQTSQSLENLTHNIKRLSHRPQSLPANSTANISDFNGSKSTSPTFHLTSSDSPLPSVDSLLCESSPCDSPQKSIGYDSVDGDVRSFEREDFLTVKRRVMADDYDTSGDTLPCPKTDRCLEHSSEEPSSTHTMTSTSSADSEFVTKSPNVSASLSPASTTLSSAVSTVTTSPRQESSFSPQSPSLKDVLALPILEDGKKPNRVELTQLSSRIKEKLKPTRNELLSLRTDKKLVEPQSTELYYADKLCYAISQTREDESNTESLSSHNDMDIKERGVTLQSIQEQYMKLEEARLLYNAIKQLDAVKINNC